MTYRLPTRTTATATCSSSGCGAIAAHREGDPGTFPDAFAGWAVGPGDARCPLHVVRAELVA